LLREADRHRRIALVAGVTALPKRDWWQNSSSDGLAEAAMLKPHLPRAWPKAGFFGGGDRFSASWGTLLMCGIIGVVAHTPVNQILYDGLLLLQHRGQDAAGIVTNDGASFHMHKASGYVRDAFRTRNMRDLSGNLGIGHCRYPTAGSASSSSSSRSRST
jgi:glutamate synthase domain-containing protein 1